LRIEHPKNVVIGDNQQFRWRAEGIIGIGEQTRVNVAVWADQWQGCHAFVQLAGNFGLPGVRPKQAVGGKLEFSHRRLRTFDLEGSGIETS
jgi:hypothetical protein